MRVVTFTRLWPNARQPNHGVFVEERMRRFAALPGCSLRVVAPIPWMPRLPIPMPERYAAASEVPAVETRHGIVVEHPRYLVVPKIGLRLQGGSLAAVATRTLARLRRAAPIDLVDAHFVYPDGYAAVVAARRLGIPVVVSARGSDIHSLPRNPGMRGLVAETLAGATLLLAVSRPLADRMIELGADPAKVVVVPNGIDAASFRFSPLSREAVRRRLGIAPETPLLLTVARLEHVKGLDVLVDALAMAARRPGAVPATLAIVGTGSLRASLEARVRDAGLAGRVIFAGAIPHELLGEWYSAADLFCLPSRAEGHPNALVEALSCGTPVVASAVGAVPDVLTERAGCVVPPENAAAFADGIALALSRARAGAWPRPQVRAEVSGRTWEHVADTVLEVFQEAAARARHKAPAPSRPALSPAFETVR